VSEPPVINIVGALVALGPIRRDLLPTYQRWVNDFETVRNLGLPPLPMTMEQEQGWFEGAAKGGQTAAFTIYERDRWTPIGNTSLMAIDYRNRTAEFGILIGEADARGKGYGTETARLMLDYAFTALGLHSVMLRVHEYNRAGQRAYAKAGYREIGRRRQDHLMGGKLWDTIYMDCLASEFTSPVLGKIFVPDEAR
jgi:RimJ/RimL family protein N-acetyltransferase